jgi:hypothetical protein
MFIGERAFQGLEKARGIFPRLGNFLLNFSKARNFSRLFLPIPGKTAVFTFQSLEAFPLNPALAGGESYG